MRKKLFLCFVLLNKKFGLLQYIIDGYRLNSGHTIWLIIIIHKSSQVNLLLYFVCVFDICGKVLKIEDVKASSFFFFFSNIYIKNDNEFNLNGVKKMKKKFVLKFFTHIYCIHCLLLIVYCILTTVEGFSPFFFQDFFFLC